MERSDFSQLKNYKPDEVPHWDKMDLMFMLAVDRLVTKTGIKGRFTSTWRAPETNKAVGGHPNSYHQVGKAGDLDFGREKLLFVYDVALASGEFGGIGLYYPEFVIHLDTGLKNEQGKTRLWSRVGGSNQPYLAVTGAFDKIKTALVNLTKGPTGTVLGLVLLAVALGLMFSRR